MQNQSEEIQAKQKRAKVKLTLRILVALYLLYLTKGIVEAAVQKTSSLPLWVTWLASAVFLLASVAFGTYAWREYKHSLTVLASECKTGGPEREDTDHSGNMDLK
nr:hypothetical protein [uncultured Caproiciproducens sp.]